MTRFFYDPPEPPEPLTVRAVQDAGGPPRRDGGWDELAALSQADRDFDAVLCSDLERIGRRPSRLLERLRVATENGLTVMCVYAYSRSWPAGAPLFHRRPAPTWPPDREHRRELDEERECSEWTRLDDGTARPGFWLPVTPRKRLSRIPTSKTLTATSVARTR